MSVVSILSSALLLFVLLNSNVQRCSAVINGKPAAPGEFPWMVSLRNETGKHYCGGALITKKHVVTAAHCLYTDEGIFSFKNVMYRPEDVAALVGTINDGKYPGQRYPASKLIVHPKYNISNSVTLTHDIGIVMLQKSVYGSRVSAIPIGEPVPEKEGVVTGWGVSGRTGGFASSESLRKLRVTVHSPDSCVTEHPKIDGAGFILDSFRTQTVICAGAENAGTCVRDSGSPLVQRGKLVGIVIFGYISEGFVCTLEFSDVYTRVASYSGFIEQVTNLLT